jgi:hypothetical protein
MRCTTTTPKHGLPRKVCLTIAWVQKNHLHACRYRVSRTSFHFGKELPSSDFFLFPLSCFASIEAYRGAAKHAAGILLGLHIISYW